MADKNDQELKAELEASHRECEGLRGDLKKANERLSALVDNDVANRVEGMLKTRYAIIFAVGIALFSFASFLLGNGALKAQAEGVLAEQKTAFEAYTKEARLAATSAEAVSDELRDHERELKKRISEAENAVGLVKDEALDVGENLSSVRADVTRVTTLNNDRLSALEDQVKRIADASTSPSLRENVAASQRAVDAKVQTFQQNYAKAVTIIPRSSSPTARKSAKDLQATLAARGYAVVVKDSDFSELGPPGTPSAPGTPGSCRIIAKDASTEVSFANDARLGCSSKVEPIPGDYQVLIF